MKGSRTWNIISTVHLQSMMRAANLQCLSLCIYPFDIFLILLCLGGFAAATELLSLKALCNFERFG